MKFIATINVDLASSPLGTRSRLGDNLLGEPVLRRTVRRVLRAGRLDSVHVFMPVSQSHQAARLLDGLPVKLETHSGVPAPHAILTRAGRLWGLDGWRGGIGGLCASDEDFHAGLITALALRIGADAVATIPAAAAVIDPAMVDAMVDHFEESSGVFRLAIVQAPPGLGLAVFGRALLEELAPSGQPPGVLLTYQPSHPGPDVTGKQCCYRPPAEVIEARGRLLCDTQRSFERVADLLEAGGESWDTARIARWLADRECNHVERVPEEIEIELTTEDPSSGGSLLRPRGSEVGRRGPIDLAFVRSVAAAIAPYDDVRVVLAGFGEPCCHPQFPEICRILRDSTAAAIAVRTSAIMAEPAIEAALFDTPVDVVEVTLDAVTRETYRRVHGDDRFDEVISRIDRWFARRTARQAVLPLVVPSFIKANETLHEMEEFLDHWQQRLGMGVITGYSHCAGQREQRAVMSMAPPQRGTCRRVFRRALILADGRLATCDQDFAGRQIVGSLGDGPFTSLWQGARLAAIRSGLHTDQPLCPACDEWHRP
jgi:hypothetical protein